MEKELIKNLLQESATKYSQSPATTNAGRWLRFVAKVIPVSTIVKLFAHKMKKPTL